LRDASLEDFRDGDPIVVRSAEVTHFLAFPESFDVKGRAECRLTAYEFSGNTRANARVLSAATRG
jgi:hypothetical protein